MKGRSGVVSVALVAALITTAARTFRAPDTYATASWLLTYGHGFIKRGLVGTVVAPLLRWKTPDEGTFILQTLAVLVLVAVGAALVRLVRPMLERGGRHPAPPFATWVAMVVGVFALVTSPWVVFAAHINGFLDHWLELLTLASLALVGTRGRWFVPVVAVLGVAVHEMFLVYGLPVVAFAVALEAAPRGWRAVVRALVALLVPVVGMSAALAWGSARLTSSAIDAVRDDVQAAGLVGRAAADNAVFYLSHDLADNASLQRTTLWQRVSRPDLLLLAGPPAALFFVWAALGLWRAPNLPRARLWLLALPVMLAPLLLHTVAWDTARFSLMIVFPAFLAWWGVFRLTPPPTLGRWAWGMVALGLAVITNNVAASVPLMDDEHDGGGALYPRAAPMLRSFIGCTPVFPNADFESGTLENWTADGTGFTNALRDTKGPSGAGIRAANQGRWWLGTYGMAPKGERGPGDSLTGTLTSVPFSVKADTLIYLLGGGHDRRDLRVSLWVEGEEVAWATGADADALRPSAWNVAAYRGRTATLVLRDEDTGAWGHLNVDGFCWLTP